MPQFREWLPSASWCRLALRSLYCPWVTATLRRTERNIRNCTLGNPDWCHAHPSDGYRSTPLLLRRARWERRESLPSQARAQSMPCRSMPGLRRRRRFTRLGYGRARRRLGTGRRFARRFIGQPRDACHVSPRLSCGPRYHRLAPATGRAARALNPGDLSARWSRTSPVPGPASSPAGRPFTFPPHSLPISAVCARLILTSARSAAPKSPTCRCRS